MLRLVSTTPGLVYPDIFMAKTIFRQTHESNDELNKRIILLKQNEDCLLNEAHELRQQNELLEFRIIELEECHEKVM